MHTKKTYGNFKMDIEQYIESIDSNKMTFKNETYHQFLDTGWGRSIPSIHERGDYKYSIMGLCSDRMQIGDLMIIKGKKRPMIFWKITEIKHLKNPRDMFDAETEWYDPPVETKEEYQALIKEILNKWG